MKKLLDCGHETTADQVNGQYYCPACRTSRNIKRQQKQFKARIEPDNPAFHALEMWFEAEHIIDAMSFVTDFANTNNYQDREITQIIEVHREV